MLQVLNPRISGAGKTLLSIGRSGGTTRILNLSARSLYSSSTDLEKYLKKLKLGRFQCFQEANPTKPCVEILKNNHEDLDIVHVRSRQPQVLYLRTELLLQRISYLEPIGITSRQKRKLIEQNPPALILDYDPERVEGSKVNYLRGVVRGRSKERLIGDVKGESDSEERLAHILHPCSPLIVMRAFDIRNNVQYIQEQLGMAQQSVLRLILNIPSFLIHKRSQMSENFHYIHKHSLPQGFDLDHHTAELYPPVYHHNNKLHPLIHTKIATEDMASSAPWICLGDVLEYSYRENNGKGKPEDLVDFLTKAEARELRPRYNKRM